MPEPDPEPAPGSPVPRASGAARVEGMPRVYSGSRRPNGATQVSVNGRPLEPRTDLRRESTTAFDWGYVGQGAPAQLALAILADHLGDDHRARRYYEHFLRSVIRGLPSESWLLTGADIDAVLPPGGY